MIQLLHRCLEICTLLLLSMCCVSSEWIADNSSLVADRNLQNVEWHEIQDNLIDSNQVPNEALNGVYSECILGLSFACLQRKLIAFLFELDRVKSINLFGNAVMVIRKKNVPVDTAESARIAQYVDQSYLKEVIDHLVDRFFDNHFLRVRIPRYLDDSEAMETGEEDLLYLDIDFKTDHRISEREDRRYWGSRKRPKKSKNARKVKKKKFKKFKLKGLKKLMMVIGLMTCLKLAAMAPVFLGMIGLKAMKALVFSIMALTIHKMMFLQKFDFSSLLSSGHGGHGGSSSGGGHGSGWDRNINEVPPTASTSTLPYYIEPPSPYSSHLASA